MYLCSHYNWLVLVLNGGYPSGWLRENGLVGLQGIFWGGLVWWDRREVPDWLLDIRFPD